MSKLIELLDKPFGDFIVLILSRCGKQPVQNERDLELISKKLSSEQVVVEQDYSIVKIVKNNWSKSTCSTSIALLTAQLLLAAIESSKAATKVSEKTLQNLLMAVESSKDKQAIIVAVKCVYLLSAVSQQSVCKFSKEVLSSLQSLVDNEVYVVCTYVRAAYVLGLATLASEQSEPLQAVFMDSLSSIYVSQGTMMIGEKDFALDINENVLVILECEASKIQKFDDENLFVLLEGILYGNRDIKSSLKVTFKLQILLDIY